MASESKKYRFSAGFTLVEMIVVLVILVILASIAIPSFTGYLRSAQEKAAITECTQCVGAAQTLTADSALSGIELKFNDASKARIQSLAGIKEGGDIVELTFGSDQAHSVVVLTYQSPNGLRVLYEDGVYSVTNELSNTLANLQSSYEAFKDKWNKDHVGVTFSRAELMESFYKEYPQFTAFQPVDSSLTTQLFGPTYTTELTWIAYPLMKNGQITDIIYYATANPPADADAFLNTADSDPGRKGVFVLINGTVYYRNASDTIGYGDPRNTSFSDAAGVISYMAARNFKTITYTL